MKKTISIVLIIAMLLSMFVMTVPAGAEGLVGLTVPTFDPTGKGVQNLATGATAVTAPTIDTSWIDSAGLSAAITTPTYDKDDFGNVKITDKAAEVAKLVAEGYKLIINSEASRAAAAAAYPDATIILFNQITSGADASNLAKYCLYENISNPSRPSGDTNDAGGAWTSGDKYVYNIIIDGCGYSITKNDCLFTHIGNVTIKNITFNGTISSNNGKSVMSEWNARGYFKAYNITTTVDITTTNKNGSQWLAGLTIAAADGSVFDNVYASGDLLFSGNAADHKLNGAGGIVASVGGAVTFNDCVTDGSITIGNGTDAMTLDLSVQSIGGIVGRTTGATTFTDCYSETAITIDSKVTLGYNCYVGGVVGYIEANSANANTITNCMNSGNISVNPSVKEGAVVSVAGIVGYENVNNTITGCVNSGDIAATTTVTARGSAVAGIVGKINDVAADISNCKNTGSISASTDYGFCVAGIAGWLQKGGSFTNCKNEGAVTFVGKKNQGNQFGVAGIAGGAYNNQNVNFSHCENSGTISVGEGNAEDDITTGGIYGLILNGAIVASYCKNTGTINGYNGSNGGYNGTAGIIASAQFWDPNRNINITYCYNNGPVNGRVAGGIFGSSDRGQPVYPYIAYCVNGEDGAINGTLAAGGIVGSNNRIADNNSKTHLNVEYCVNNGAVSSKNSAGGIVGYMMGTSKVTNSINNADFAVPASATGGNLSIGGIVGRIDSATATIDTDVNAAANTYNIENCFNYGDIDIAEGADLDKTKFDNGIAGIAGRISGKTAIKNCVNEGNITSKAKLVRAFGGIVGMGGYNSPSSKQVSLVNCINKGDIKVSIVVDHGDWTPSGGIMGYNYASNAELVRIYSCTNEGDLVDTTTTDTNGRFVKAGIVGGVRGCKEVIIKNCINKGDMTAGALKNRGENYSAGIIGIYGSVGNWMGNTTVANTLTIEQCTNEGVITGKQNSAGILARTMEIAANAEAGFSNAILIKDCLNAGAVTNSNGWAGGLVGGAIEASKGDCSLTIQDSANTAKISGSTRVAGIIVTLTAAAVKTKFDNCYNSGEIKVSGGGSSAGGFVAYIDVNTAKTENFTNTDEAVNAYLETVAPEKREEERTKYKNLSVRVGYNLNTTPIEFEECYNNGYISYSGDGWYDSNIKNKYQYFNGPDQDGKATYTTKTTYDAEFAKTHMLVKAVDGGAKMRAIAGIVAEVYGGTVSIKNSANYGKLALTGDGANTTVGGIVGGALEDTAISITDSENNGAIESASTKANASAGIGGIMGASGRDINGSSASVSIEGCTNNATIKLTRGTNYNVGGIIGVANNVVDIFDNTNNGALDITYKGAETSGIGGIAGRIGTRANCETDIELNGNSNNGTVEVKSIGTEGEATVLRASVGGIVGVSANGETTIEDCYNNNKISVSGEGAESVGVAGIVGRAGIRNTSNSWVASSINLIGCLNNAEIETVEGTVNYNIAGIIASLNNASARIEACVNAEDGVITDNCTYRRKWKEDASLAEGGTWETVYQGMGGILGFAHSPDRNNQSLYIDNCQNLASITHGNSNNVYIGGIAGWSRFITDTDIINCYNKGAVTSEHRQVAGILGSLGSICTGWGAAKTGTCDIVNCVNDGAITGKNFAAGIVSDLWEIGNGASDLEKHIITINVQSCVNNGAITATGGDYATGIFSRIQLRGGKTTVTVSDCINTGAITASGGLVSGIVSEIRAQEKVSDHNVKIERCVNTATITSGGSVCGGIVGRTGCADGRGIKLTVDTCANYGAINGGANCVGGILADACDLTDSSEIALNNVMNSAAVSGGFQSNGGNAGGIFGTLRNSKGTFKIDNAVNYGTVTAKEWNVAGIFAQNQNSASAYITINNAVNFGKITSSVAGSSKENGIGTGTDSISATVYYYAEAVDAGSNNAGTKIEDFDTLLALAITYSELPYSFERLEAALPLCQPYFDNEADYIPEAMTKLHTDYNNGQAMITAGFYKVVGGKVVFASQKAIEKQVATVLDAIKYTYRKSEAGIYFEDILARADKFMAENETSYVAEKWDAFIAAYVEVKAIAAEGDINSQELTVLYNKANVLRIALEALQNEDSRGGEINSAADFALLNGQTGEFFLNADITISQSIEDFNGTLYGNGHTITLNGCTIFENIENAKIYALNINGTVSKDAKSIFGLARGTNELSGMLIDVDGHLDNALVTGRATVAISNILVMSDADVLIRASRITASNVYLDAKDYYNANGQRSTDVTVFASGEITYQMNRALGLNNYLVQTIGKDSLPKVAAVLADGSNVVDYANGKYFNIGMKYDVDFDTEAPEINIPLVYAPLNAAIARAEALVEADYTADSWAALQTVLSVARGALDSDAQETIDNATSELLLAVAKLVKKPAEVAGIDLTKLDEAIAKAQALKIAEYTSASWSYLQTSIVLAKAAKIAKTQAEVDAAIAALDAAIAALVKAPVKQETPNTPKPTEPAPAKDKGCGSVIGGAAIAVVAVMTLGMGLTFKKKED